MKQTFYKFISSRIVFFVITTLTVITGISAGICCFVNQNFTDIFVPFAAILIGLLYCSYASHNKNLMKALLGAVLMWIFAEELSFSVKAIWEWREEFSVAYGSLYATFRLIRGMGVLCTLLMLFLHFLINGDRLCRPMELKVNRLLTCLLIFIYIEDVLLTQYIAHLMTVQTGFVLTFKVFALLCVLWVELRLDESRQLREQQGFIPPAVSTTNPGVLLVVVTVLAVVSGLADFVTGLLQKQFQLSVLLPVVGMSLWLLLSYCRHEKNLMKALMGAILLWLLYDAVGNSVNLLTVAEETGFPVLAFVKLLGVLLYLGVFALHLRINSIHESSPFEVRINQGYFCALLLLNLLELILKTDTYSICVFRLSLVAMIVLLETQLDHFRQKRETANR